MSWTTGKDEITITLTDSGGLSTSQNIWVNVSLFTYNLQEGWNMIGWVGSTTNAKVLAYGIMDNSSNSASLSIVIAAKWNNGENNWDGYIYGYSPNHYSFAISSGNGCFIYVDKASDFEI